MNALFRHSGALASAALGAPLGALALLARPRWRAGLRERLGGIDAADGAGGAWLHAASLGELRAAAALVPGLHAAGLPVAVSTATNSARGQIEAQCGRVAAGLMPLDHPWCTERALSRVRPRALVLIETELWPTWIASAQRRGIPVLVASARLSDRNFARLTRLRPLLARTFARLSAVGARSQPDAERFAALGVDEARIRVTGDLKLASVLRPLPAAAPDFESLTAALIREPVWVAGSLHPGEFAPVLDALDQVEAAAHALRLVIAPRHLECIPELVRAIEARNRPVRLRSRWTGPGEHLPGRAVLVLDSHGELATLYAHASVAFVGGTFGPIGGHDLLEPVAAGSAPVLFGPHTQNQRDAQRLLIESGAGVQVSGALELGHALLALLERGHPSDAVARARRALEAESGTVERTLAWILEHLPDVSESRAEDPG